MATEAKKLNIFQKYRKLEWNYKKRFKRKLD